MNIDIPEGKNPIGYVWGEMVPGIGPAAAGFSQKVYTDGTLGLREFEAARLRIAQINGCIFCQDWRTERDGETVESTFDQSLRRQATPRGQIARGIPPAPPRARRRVLGTYDRSLLPARNRRVEHVPRIVVGLRPAQPRPRPRYSMCVARQLN